MELTRSQKRIILMIADAVLIYLVVLWHTSFYLNMFCCQI